MSLTFKEKEKELKDVFKAYNKAKTKLYYLEHDMFIPSSSMVVVSENATPYVRNHYANRLNRKIDDCNDLKDIINSFDLIVENLTYDSKTIIRNEFMDNCRRDWWEQHYSRSTYYRLKTRAMEEMLYYLYI